MANLKCPPFLEPRLRIFLSADIVGSTALKQLRAGAQTRAIEESSKGPAWFSAIQGFYFEAVQAFLISWEQNSSASAQKDDLYGPVPEFWKSVGDEVIFIKHVTDHRQLATTLHCWFEAVNRMRSFLKNENQALDVKCSTWMAGFPFNNREVVIGQPFDVSKGRIENYYKTSGDLLNKHYKNQKTSKLSIDYIGPSIDTGFRLGQYSSGRKMVLSIDVAYMLSMTNFDGEVKRINLFYDGAQMMKGVFGGSLYPIFWIDMSSDDSLAVKEDKLKSHQACNKEDIKEYCDAFYREFSAFTFRPFVQKDPGQTLAKMPDWYQDYHSALVKNFNFPDLDYAGDDSQIANQPGEDADPETLEQVAEDLSARLGASDATEAN